MWKLDKTEENKRHYVNSTTGGRCVTEKLYTDKEGNDWYGFTDLLSLPYTRHFAATKVSSLFALGLTKDDLNSHINGSKFLLNSNDPEMKQKLYANILDFETKANNAMDPLKQMSSLVCVYYLIGDEPIDSFNNEFQIKKMGLLEADTEMHAFFLKSQMSATENSMTRLQQLSRIVFPEEKEIN